MLNFSNPAEDSYVDIGDCFKQEYIILLGFICHIWVCIAIFGLVGNAINITVFVKIRPKDNITITLLALSISDLINLCINSLSLVARFMEANYKQYNWTFDKYILIFGPFWYAQMFYDYSAFVSVFLAGVRCACVASPLRFKSMFTKSRTITVLCLLFLTALILRMPVLTVFSLTWAVNPQTNGTYRTIKYSRNSGAIYRVNDILNRNFVSSLTYMIMVTSVIVLASKLQKASRFRRTLTSFGRAGVHKTADETSKVSKFSNGTGAPKMVDQEKNSSETMSSKDLQVIQSVTLICVIFILSQLPFQVVSTVRLFLPEFSSYGTLRHLYGFVVLISNTCSYLNVSLNILIHARFNSRYRQILLGLFSK